MYNALVFGFEEQIEELKKSDLFKISFFLGKSPECDVHYRDVYDLNIEYKKIDQFSYKVYKKIFDNFFSDFFNMCARHDAGNNRAHHDYYDLFNIYFYYFYNILTGNNIDLFLTSCLPHVGSDNLMYLIAKELNIKTIILHQSIFPDRLFYMNDVNDYAEFHKFKPLRKREKYTIVNKQVTVHANLDLTKIKRYNFSIKSIFLLLINSKNFINLFRYKKIKKFIKNIDFFTANLWRYKRFKEYKKNIDSLTVNTIDLNTKFIYFPLQLNPELTTSFLGGDFFDQILAIERLSNLIPDSWWIYIKENPKQTEFMRGKWVFKRLKALKNIIFVPYNTDTYVLIRNSQFVATVTGTAGWEAITNFKNALVFGNAWYKYLPGVFMYTNNLKIDEIINYKIDKSELEEAISDMLRKLGEGVVEMVYKEIVPDFDPIKNSKKIRYLIENILS